MASANADNSEETLSEMFSKGLALHSDLESSSEDTNSEAYQLKVQKSILMLEDATRLVSILDLFSRNETVSEVPTSSLKFFLLPVLLGDLNAKLSEREHRLDLIQVVETYYIDFLRRVRDYEIVENLKIPEIKQDDEEQVKILSGPPDLDLLNQERNAKIDRYKSKKSLESRIKELQTSIQHPTCDEDLLREFYLKLIQKFVISTLDELESLRQEKQILQHMAKMRAGQIEPPKAKQSRPLQPIIITRDAVQKHVFGMGYPSLPVLSIEEFYEERARTGWFGPPQKKPASLMDHAFKETDVIVDKEAEEAQLQEEKEEQDDEQELARKRAWDEYKDEHKRGEGNRHNKG